MKLRMYNVGFGDCFLIYKDDAKLLVDIGSISFTHDTFNRLETFVENLVDTTLVNSRNTAILTHLHKDHYEGFNHMKNMGYQNLFEKFYVPCITYDDGIGKYVMLELAYYMYLIFGNSTVSGILGKRILTLISSVYSITRSGNIKSLYRGSIIDFEGRKFEVLWPPLIYNFDDTLLKHIEEIEDRMKEFPYVLDLKEKIINNIVECYSIINQKDILRENQTEELKRIINNQNTIIGEISRLIESVEFQDRINEIILDRERISYSTWYKKICHSTTRIFNKNCNALSIVFHDINCFKSILMMGDITDDIIDNYLVSDFYENYHCMKVPHHGTESHYSYNLPETENFFISTGAHGRNGKISMSYRNHNSSVGTRKCSNGGYHCEILDSGYSCINPRCRNMITEIHI